MLKTVAIFNTKKQELVRLTCLLGNSVSNAARAYDIALGVFSLKINAEKKLITDIPTDHLKSDEIGPFIQQIRKHLIEQWKPLNGLMRIGRSGIR